MSKTAKIAGIGMIAGVLLTVLVLMIASFAAAQGPGNPPGGGTPYAPGGGPHGPGGGGPHEPGSGPHGPGNGTPYGPCGGTPYGPGSGPCGGTPYGPNNGTPYAPGGGPHEPGSGPHNPGWARSQEHQVALHSAIATTLGMNETELETALAAGQTIWQLAESRGIDPAILMATMQGVHETILAEAVTNGEITQEQADWLLSYLLWLDNYAAPTGSDISVTPAPSDQ